jgi:tRNA dimethylallyltransferase
MSAALPVLVLFGPTASGKTALLERLFTGGGIVCPAEIICADSMQVYRGMDIGTAKPSVSLRKALPHHLVDILEPDSQFNAGSFVSDAARVCHLVHERGRLPVLSGGTGFYLKNFIEGLPASPPSDAAIREGLMRELRAEGGAALYRQLCEIDGESAARIHPNDEYRLIRALEVFRLTGRPLSSFSANQGRSENNYRFLLIGLEWERETLYQRINKRCAEMFRSGLANEVKVLFERGLTPADPGLKAIGYKEFFVLNEDGTWRLSNDIAGVQALVSQHSRQYAKRQITWFKKIDNVRWIALDENPAAFERAINDVSEKIKLFLEDDDGV